MTAHIITKGAVARARATLYTGTRSQTTPSPKEPPLLQFQSARTKTGAVTRRTVPTTALAPQNAAASQKGGYQVCAPSQTPGDTLPSQLCTAKMAKWPISAPTARAIHSSGVNHGSLCRNTPASAKTNAKHPLQPKNTSQVVSAPMSAWLTMDAGNAPRPVRTPPGAAPVASIAPDSTPTKTTKPTTTDSATCQIFIA